MGGDEPKFRHGGEEEEDDDDDDDAEGEEEDEEDGSDSESDGDGDGDGGAVVVDVAYLQMRSSCLRVLCAMLQHGPSARCFVAEGALPSLTDMAVQPTSTASSSSSFRSVGTLCTRCVYTVCECRFAFAVHRHIYNFPSVLPYPP